MAHSHVNLLAGQFGKYTLNLLRFGHIGHDDEYITPSLRTCALYFFEAISSASDQNEIRAQLGVQLGCSCAET